MSLLSLQGYIRIGTRLPSGKCGAMFWAGNVPEATLDLSVENATKNESFTGGRMPYGKRKTGQTGRFTGVFDEWNLRNLALGLHAKELAVETGSVTGEVFPTGLVAGDQVRLAHSYVSSLVVTDSTGSPITVDSGDYRLVGHNASVVEMLDVTGSGPYVQPFKAAYTYAAYNDLEVFGENPQEVWVMFDGINTETGDGVQVDLYRVGFDPFTNFGLIHAEYGNLPFAADVLYDPLNAQNDGKGGYYKIRQKTPA